MILTPAACADDGAKLPAIDLSRWNDQPIYPNGAVERNEQGTAVIAVDVDQRGRIVKISLDKTSGFDDLDQTAVATAKSLRYNAGSDGHKDVAGTMKLNVHFQLTTLPQPAITDADIYALKDAGDMVTCRRVDPELGSNITPKPVCHTQREWEQIAKIKKDGKVPQRPRGSFWNPGN